MYSKNRANANNKMTIEQNILNQGINSNTGHRMKRVGSLAVRIGVTGLLLYGGLIFVRGYVEGIRKSEGNDAIRRITEDEALIRNYESRGLSPAANDMREYNESFKNYIGEEVKKGTIIVKKEDYDRYLKVDEQEPVKKE